MFEDYENEGLNVPDENAIREELLSKAREEFKKAAYKGYDILITKGRGAIEEGQKDEAVTAIRRILGLMIEEEEYEKCGFIKNFLEKELGVEPEPFFDFPK